MQMWSTLESPLIPVSDRRIVELAQTVVSFVRDQSELLTSQTIHLHRSILDALRYNVPLHQSDFVGRSGHHHSDDDIKGGK
jgi:hypothetical protein